MPRKATATSFAASPDTTDTIPAPARGNNPKKFAFRELIKFCAGEPIDWPALIPSNTAFPTSSINVFVGS